MHPGYQKILAHARSQKAKIAKTAVAIRKIKDQRKVDKAFHESHDEVFSDTDCLQCANCCRTTGPLLTRRDADRLSETLGISVSHFEETYTRIDEDGDRVFRSMPCPFLETDNACSVYESRPKACREYPHTDRQNIAGILGITKENIMICPAAARIWFKVEARLKL